MSWKSGGVKFYPFLLVSAWLLRVDGRLGRNGFVARQRFDASRPTGGTSLA
jgi:hypothetical protein